MQHGKILIQEVQIVIKYAGIYVILLTSHLRYLSTQCLHSLLWHERFYHVFNDDFYFSTFLDVFLMFFKIVLQRFYIYAYRIVQKTSNRPVNVKKTSR